LTVAWSGLDISKLVLDMRLRSLCQHLPQVVRDIFYKPVGTGSEVIED
jgi:hypothetical protein